MINGLLRTCGTTSRATFALCCTVLLGAAGADTRESIVRALAAQDAALSRVGERLRRAALPYCPRRGYAGGLLVQSISQYGTAYRGAARGVLGLGEQPGVVLVEPGGPAARAGIRAGDAITAIDGTATSRADLSAAPTMADTDRALGLIERGFADGHAALAVLRDGRPLTVRIDGDPACLVRFEVRAGGSANASTDSMRIIIASDLVDPAAGDADLASLAAHELAHVILRHPDVLRDRYRGVFPGFGKGGKALRASEIAADRLSVYLLALAGYREADAVGFWTRYGRRTDQGILSDRTHPGWKTRVAAIQREVDRVAAQRAAGQPIAPPADLLATPSG